MVQQTLPAVATERRPAENHLQGKTVITCSIDGCEKPVSGRGWCQIHYLRWHRLGDPLAEVKKQRERGTGHINADGYLVVQDGRGRKMEHVSIVESALGRALPPNAVVHHVNENRLDNHRGNLVVCPDESYHKLLHQRMRALTACGNANWKKCVRCHQYDSPESMKSYRNHKTGRSFYHQACDLKYRHERLKNKQIKGQHEYHI